MHELDKADKDADNAFRKAADNAKNAKIYYCPGPRKNPIDIPLDLRTPEQKLRDERWEKAKKK